MKLIVGLGNPGKKYDQTRHNVGFDVIREIGRKFDVGRPKARFQGETVDFQLGGELGTEKIILLSPLTYMNESGRSVRAAVDFFQLDETRDLLIICDDFHLEFGKIRFRPKGSSGGQRGLESIIGHLGQDLSRLRIGIGIPPAGWKVSDYVLSRFREEESEELKECVSRSAAAALCWAEHGVSEAMNRYNSNEKPSAKAVKKQISNDENANRESSEDVL